MHFSPCTSPPRVTLHCLHKSLHSYIEKTQPAIKTRKLRVPWLAFFKSGPFWATIFTHVCYNWCYYVVMSWLPDYFKSAFGANYSTMGCVSQCLYVYVYSDRGMYTVYIYYGGASLSVSILV